MDAEALETVRQLKGRVAEIQAVDADSISLAHKDQTLPDGATVKNCGLKEGDSLSVIPRDPKGGLNGVGPSSPFSNNILKNRLVVEAQRIHDARIPLRAVTPLEWTATLPGRGRWRHQTFQITILLPYNYPARPPMVTFVTKPSPRHPNVSDEGWVCLNYLQDSWTPVHNLVSVYRGLEWLLENPNYHHPLNFDAMPPMDLGFGRFWRALTRI
ncbi:MAG: hypothetical protein HY556_02050 [Euryarchaeota archaeon]|nr:hypothetical protein [Euryarchaeota archaeon]